MKKSDLIARAVALGLGDESKLKAMDETALTALLKENDPDFKPAAETQPQKKGSKADKDEGDPRTGKKVNCRIEIGSETTEKGPVYACVNGFDFQAPRGKEIELDEGFVKHLQSQMVTESEAVVDDKGRPTGEVVERDRPRFQVTVLS